MRHWILGVGLLLPALPVQATIVELGPNFFINSISGPSFTIDNFEIVEQSSATSQSGSGFATALIDDWDDAELRTFLLGGPGEATASLTNIATFDLVFDSPGLIELDVGFGLDGIGGPGSIDTDPGDNSFASWDMSVSIEGFPDFIGESQEHQCVGGVPVVGDCVNFFDFSAFPLFTTLTDDLRLTVSTRMRFDIGVSTAAAVVPVSEPGMLTMLLLSLGWLGRRRLAAGRA
ncbi:MAG: MYXO-CTERM sorting domain-containing protein [Alphaproteobacteria bacterium]